MQDSLGDRMKQDYEDRTRYTLPRRTYTIARVDGKAFHTYTKTCKKPFDDLLMYSMNRAAQYVCGNVQGCQLAYIQSDEVSFLITDFNTIATCAYFDGNIQKIGSVIASMFTGWFNLEHKTPDLNKQPAAFDCRVFSIPDPVEVENYFYWRWSDWRRNFAQAVGHANFSHKELEGLNRQQIQDKLYDEKKIDLSMFPEDQKHGRLCVKKSVVVGYPATVINSYWEVIPCVNFKEKRDFLQSLVPRPGY